MSCFPERHAIIIGGGASGVLLAYQLLQHPHSDFRVTLIEKRCEIGRGLAYHTGNADHLLNVRAANMSALPDDPDHFWRWLSTSPNAAPFRPDPYCFVPRRLYGDYIASLVDPFLSPEHGEQRLTIVRGECIAVSEGWGNVTVSLADGSRLVGDVAVLATGHDAATARSAWHADPWISPSVPGFSKDAAVLILGTGLTMADYVLTLLREGHRGPIIAMSRRGLMARGHRRTAPLSIREEDIPFGAGASTLLRWFRQRIAAHVAAGGDWRSVIDAVRPFSHQLWRELPASAKRSFLEHARAWWDVHRHRMAPEVEARIVEAIADGQLTVTAAKLVGIEGGTSGARVRYRRRGRPEAETIEVGAIVDCTGIVRDPRATINPAVRSLFDQGLARPDPLRIGIDVTAECTIIHADGTLSQRLFAIGPLTRAAFWEIMAIPDIRNQCAALAAQLVQGRAALLSEVIGVQPPVTDQQVAI
ncbi:MULTISPECIES: FAD/NAD(P)-binding protein [unclassified Bradyrhizobium]|uniref:FAD/NAD(P)-binding protein n=1 Tax=unclassified Bradyrhizobium TaxID=2631580 RepID=UPI0028EA46CF|nr:MULTISPECIES: FAD/NAD(P)-binding protein [unclassified Bradyrhizobium]